MNQVLNGKEIAARVLGSTGGAAAKGAFKVDAVNFMWVDMYLQDKAIRNKINTFREGIQRATQYPISRDELRIMFDSALARIAQERLEWFIENLKAAQDRTGSIVNSDTLRARNYIPPTSLTENNIVDIFKRLPEGVKQAEIDMEIHKLQEQIKEQEAVISIELSPPNRWVYRDDGKPYPYPQGCRWTQYVGAWEMVASRFQGPVSVEGDAIKTDSEMTAYVALGLDKIARIEPLRTPY